jgi:hypothetical protein
VLETLLLVAEVGVYKRRCVEGVGYANPSVMLHVIALLATVRDDDLVARPSFWQRTQTRKALERGDPVALVVHEDVLVFRKPTAHTQAGAPDHARQGRLAA